MTIGLENVLYLVMLHHTPVFRQSEIADKTKHSLCLCFVVNNKPSLLQSINLLHEGYSLFRVTHSDKKKRPGVLHSPCEDVCRDLSGAKLQLIFESANNLG